MNQTPRDNIELRIIGYLNDRKLYHEHYYDCGELGVLYIYWNRGWVCEWVEILPYPTELEVK